MSRNMTKKLIRQGMMVGLALACYVPLCIAGAKAIPKLNKKEVTVETGKSVTIKVLHINKKVKIKWSSKNKKIAIVKKGKITGKKEGTTKVIATVGKRKLTCKVKVLSSEKSTPAPVVPTPANTPAAPQGTVLPSVEPSPTVIPTATPAVTDIPASPAPTISASPVIAEPGSEEYEKAMVSGTEEDFNKYFARKRSDYTKKNQDYAHGKMTAIQYESSVVGSMRDANVYTPADYQEGEEYPVVYMLHGLGCDCNQWKSMSIANVLDNMIARNEIKPVVAVFPGIIPKDGLNQDTFSQDNIQAFNVFVDEFTEDLEPYILENYSVSDKREDTGVCGLSMGGMEALALGFSLQNRFNYIGSFSAAPSLDTSLLKYADDNVKPELVLVCTGTNDTTIGDNPLKYHEELTKNGVKHIWYQYPKGTHSDPVWINGVINFLLRSYAP